MSPVIFMRTNLCLGLLACLAMPAWAETPISYPAVPAREKAALERIEAALAKRVSWDYDDVPLQELIAVEAKRAAIPIVLTKKIEDAGVQPDAPVSLRVKDVSFESALTRALGNLNLTFLIKDEMLLVTTVEDAHSPENVVVRVYPVADLVKAADGTFDYDPLIDLISGTIDPDSWGDRSGPAPIYSFPNSPALVISQRRDVHQRIEALLVTLRRVREVQGTFPKALMPVDRTPLPFGTPGPSEKPGGLFEVPTAPAVRSLPQHAP